MRILMLLRPNYKTVFGGDKVQTEKLIEQLEKCGHKCLRDVFKTRYDYPNKKYLISEHVTRFKPDIAILWNKNNNQVLAARKAGVKKVLWFTVMLGYYASKEQGIWKDHQEIANNVDGLIFLGEGERDYWKKWHTWSCRDHIVPNGVEVPDFSSVTVSNPFWDRCKFLFMPGRIEPNKNQIGVIRALKLLGVNAPFTYICGKPHGPKSYVQSVISESQDLGRKVIINTDGLPHVECLKMMQLAYTVIQPSHFECAPLVAFEAAKMGANVIVTKVSSAYDYLGDTAFYTDHVPNNIADAIMKSYKTKRNGQARLAIAPFTWESAGEKLEKVLLEFLK